MEVLNKMILDCRMGMDKRLPVIWIKTNEIELVRRIAKSGRLVPNLRKMLNAWQAADALGNDRSVWGDLESGRNIKFADMEKLGEYFDGACIDELSDIKNPPHLFIAKADEFDDERSTRSFWQGLLPFIDVYVSDALEETPLGRSAVILFSEKVTIPSGYVPYVHIVDEPYPKRDELEKILGERLQSDYFVNERILQLANEMVGFSLIRAEQTASYIAKLFADEYSREMIEAENEGRSEKDKITPRRIIIDERAGELKRSDLLTLMEAEDSEIAGIEAFENWMNEQKIYLESSNELRGEYNVKAPKGVLLCGIPGTGKSAMAKKFAYTTGMKLLRMDIGKLMGSYVGESEHNMDKALKIVDATAPCVLFIDELDKSFEGAKASSGGTGSDTTLRRMFATLLTWMQEHKSAVFVFATANDISALPKEFFRSGRFDCMFSLFMPGYEECVKIFESHIKKRIGDASNPNGLRAPFLDYKASDIAKRFMNILQKYGRFVTGADIEKLVELTLRRIYKTRSDDASMLFSNKKRIEISKIELIFEEVLQGKEAEDGHPREIGTSVYGDSKEQIDGIALCYIRLLRNNFVPVTNDPMFSNYSAKVKNASDKKTQDDGWPSFTVTVEKSNTKYEYDRTLQNLIYEKMIHYAAKYEQEMLGKMF